ncbi:unnamed protein product [Rotaria sp. Silwood2]|nr:unnamed protein product [Rotaria sp. Silwood2]CAF4592806.1 unnamed protein product [Rotaria sp. Silwood2]
MQEASYVMFKNNQNITDLTNLNYTNNDFEGFCVDLLAELSRALKFCYEIKPITTLCYDDMVEEVKNKRADLAVAPLTINYVREKEIDFTKPFLSWIYTFAAVFTVSFILLLIARCSPDEW